MSTTPDRSDNKPAKAQKISGVETRTVEASNAANSVSSMGFDMSPGGLDHA
jgi:hypothetical protein